MLVGIEYHRVLSYDKLFCKCRYLPLNQNLRRFQVRISEKIHNFLTNDNYCEYQQQQIPAEINEKILKIATGALHQIPELEILKEILFCRKQILDGSLVTGFQKSAIIAHGGYILLKNSKKVQIDKIYLEQDSAAKVKGEYFVGRMGLPLLEVTTKPQELNFNQLIELLQQVEKLLNWKFNLPISPFTRRQDINLSIAGHPKVEYKGVSSLSEIQKIMDIEEKIQLQNIEKKDLKDNQTKKLIGGLPVILRTSLAKKRMKQETELPLIKLNFSSKKHKKNHQLICSIQNQLNLENFTNLKEVKRLNYYNKKYQLSKKDVDLYQHLKKNKLDYSYNKLSYYDYFLKFLKDQISEYALRTKDLHLKPYSKVELDLAYASTSSEVSFYKTYKKFIYRSYIFKK